MHLFCSFGVLKQILLDSCTVDTIEQDSPASKAREWGTAVWDANDTCCSTYERFTEEMKKVFNRSYSVREAAREIMARRQGTRSVFDYAIEFCTLSASCKWNDDALYDAFLNGLSDSVKDELVPRELPSSLTDLMDLAGRIDARIRQRKWEKASTPLRLVGKTVPTPAPEQPPPEPMQIDRARVTPEERQRRRDACACFYCGELGHFCLACPLKDKARQ